MWQFFDNHPIYAAVLIAATFVLIVLVIFILIKLSKNGGVRARIGNNELEIGKKNKNFNEPELMRDMLILCNSINQWQKQLDRQIDIKTKETVSSAIRFANAKIDNFANIVKLDYGDFLKKQKKEITQEDNYQIIIYGFLVDQMREELKDIICGAIREDHFDSKTNTEINSIGENAKTRVQIIFENKSNVLNKGIVEKINEKNIDKVKEEIEEIISLSANKYKLLREEIEEIIETEEKGFREVLKLKFPNISQEGIDNIVNYYN